MDKQQNAPIEHPMFFGQRQPLTPVWRRWFQNLKIRDDEIRKAPYKTYTADTQLTTWELGKVVQFDCTSADLVATLPTVEAKDLWAWLTILRIGTYKLTVTADPNSYIEYSSIGGSLYCEETRRRAANVQLQLVGVNQWAIIAGFGIWEVE